MTKKELRKKYKAMRLILSQKNIEDYSLAIANRLLTLPIWNFEYYHIFLTIEEQKEVNTDYTLNILSGKDKHIVVSKSNFETNQLNHFLLTDSTIIKKNHYNIPEPTGGIPISNTSINVVFVPLLAYDIKGNRVGYGKGFYDAFLSGCKPNVLKIGLSFFDAETIISDIYESDIKLDFCVTPFAIHSFK